MHLELVHCFLSCATIVWEQMLIFCFTVIFLYLLWSQVDKSSMSIYFFFVEWIVFSTPSCASSSATATAIANENIRLSECTTLPHSYRSLSKKKKHIKNHTHQMIYSFSKIYTEKVHQTFWLFRTGFEHVACIKRALYALNFFLYIPSCNMHVDQCFWLPIFKWMFHYLSIFIWGHFIFGEYGLFPLHRAHTYVV